MYTSLSNLKESPILVKEFSGMCLVSVAAVILSVFFYSDLDALEDANLVTAIKLYRPGFSIWLFLLFIGVNIWGWRTAGVNHVLIFEIDPREHLRTG